MGFQTQVNAEMAPGMAGDFASGNPITSAVGPEGGFVAGSAGVTVGRFAWIQADGYTVLNTGSGAPHGFVPRAQQAVITTYLAESGNVIPAGFSVTLIKKADFFVTSTIAASVLGNKAFAKLTDGTMQPAASGATVSGYVETSYTISQACLLNELAIMSN